MLFLCWAWRMGIKQYSLQEIKKELQQLDGKQCAELCVRLARYKRDNKELLAYLMFEAQDDMAFAETIKQEMGLMIAQLPVQSYNAAKTLRKVLKMVSKYAKFTASKQVEIELLLCFCRNYIIYVNRRADYKPLRAILVKQLQKIVKLTAALHEDLQFDYTQELELFIAEASARFPWLVNEL